MPCKNLTFFEGITFRFYLKIVTLTLLKLANISFKIFLKRFHGEQKLAFCGEIILN